MKILKLPRPATVQDLLDLDEKAEIVNGQIVLMGKPGVRPARAAARIWKSLEQHELTIGGGVSVPEGGDFLVQLPNRESFSPDASWYYGAEVDGPVDGPPALAVEVRSPGDYGLRAERNMAAKRAEYFAAGTQVVWDVDCLREQLIRVYRADDPETPTVYHRGEIAEAEPAVPGWRFPVDALFPRG
ncbi:Uma2 family endonuclease [Longimicrobium sp.]|uniref:Uma2 family endonuclease n=1 Tax=Longimicrobium sp. TaxID=2029185 RepID=UPI002C59A2CE|nr:Uma2 family endonuclease [Longimicrobium sp.]HSU13167.1 Uma2 family endonuclease [Longimicrobium sp.]